MIKYVLFGEINSFVYMIFNRWYFEGFFRISSIKQGVYIFLSIVAIFNSYITSKYSRFENNFMTIFKTVYITLLRLVEQT